MAVNSIEKLAERLRHASDALGWMASGKRLQAKHLYVGGWESFGAEKPIPSNVVKGILSGVWTYRVEQASEHAKAACAGLGDRTSESAESEWSGMDGTNSGPEVASSRCTAINQIGRRDMKTLQPFTDLIPTLTARERSIIESFDEAARRMQFPLDAMRAHPAPADDAPIESIEIIGQDSDGDLCVYLCADKFKKGRHVRVVALGDTP